jgi:hypothetical protein
MHLGQRCGAAALLQQLVAALVIKPAALRAAVPAYAVRQQLAECGRLPLGSCGVPAPGVATLFVLLAADSRQQGWAAPAGGNLRNMWQAYCCWPCCRVGRQLADSCKLTAQRKQGRCRRLLCCPGARATPALICCWPAAAAVAAGAPPAGAGNRR